MKARTTIKLICAAFVACCIGYVAWGFIDGDYSDNPDKQKIEATFAPFFSEAGGEREYFDKMSLKGAYAVSRLPEARGRIIAVATREGWVPKKMARNGRVTYFCQGRMTLSLENFDSTSIEYGVYWASDQHSSLYCAPR